ncbi:alpha/beta fold hydrolase [Microbispora sp. KK1-11]|uniref:alpha/beta fold hydrolase n=1 Tax=Microbispora sp. KK1-11 TaxID=2053005 RepID=UPI00163CFBD9|nr:alpha/beta fold hydrolase [Microbispora sp. KK1-11]
MTNRTNRPVRPVPVRSAHRVKTLPVVLSALSAFLGLAVLPAAAQTAPTLAWRACPGGQGPAEMECTTIEVPVDWSAPGRTTIKLELARLPAADPSLRLGSVLVVSDGGPGIQGVLSSAPESFTKLRKHFDVVGYNPRTSTAGRYLPPSCAVPGLPLNDPRDRAAYEAQAAALERLVDRCRQDDMTGLADHLDSDSVARDMEAIRIALGQDRLTMLAFSYGGVPAAAYARLYPGRVRAMVLDSTPDATVGWRGMERAQLRATEAAFKRFTTWCAGDDACALRGRNVRKLWRELIKSTGRRPVTYASARLGEIRLTDLHLKALARVVLPLPEKAPEFADALLKASKGDFAWFGEQILGVSASWSSPGAAATRCPDGLVRLGYEALVSDRRYSERISHDFGGGVGIGLEALACSGWRHLPVNPPRPLPAGLPPALGLGGDRDFTVTELLVSRIPGSVTVRYDGPVHVVYLRAKDPCVTGYADRYLTKLTLAPAGTLCSPR